MRFEYLAFPRASMVRVQLWRRSNSRRPKFSGSFCLPPDEYVEWRDSFAWGSRHTLSELELASNGNGRRYPRKRSD
jgi:hypothetical protein